MALKASRRIASYLSAFGAALLSASAWSQSSTLDEILIDPDSWSPCLGQSSCVIGGASLTASGGTFEQKILNDAPGLGVSGGSSGSEIDIGQSVLVTFDGPRTVGLIKIVFIFNGPEYDDRAEVAQITADGVVYTLAVGNDQDDAQAAWSGAGTVDNCGATTAAGTGCFLITNPFPTAVTDIEFGAVTGNEPYAGGGTNDSDYAIGLLQADPGLTVDLRDCGPENACPVATVDGQVAASIANVTLADPETGFDTQVYRVVLPDCRYIPQICRDLLLGGSPPPVSDATAREFLITAGVIKALDPSGPNRLSPAAQLLNVTPFLPAVITSQFDASGIPPNGLPELWISAPWRGQAAKGHFIEALFFKTAAGVSFRETFLGEFDVSVLTGSELGCEPVPGQLLAWDVITTVNETYKSAGGRYIDTITNIGCRNPTKISASRLSLYPFTMEIAPDTWGPTIRTLKPTLTVNNDAVFARLVQYLWTNVGNVRANLACKQVDAVPTGGTAPIGATDCAKLAVVWAVAKLKVDLCVAGTFVRQNAISTGLCTLARNVVTDYAALLPAAPAGQDVANRLGEQKALVETFLHVWDTRFLPSIKPTGFCREKNTCAP